MEATIELFPYPITVRRSLRNPLRIPQTCDNYRKSGLSIVVQPNFRNMSKVEFLAFLKDPRVSKTDKNMLARPTDRNTSYGSKVIWYVLQDAKSAVSEFHNFMLYNRIFISQDLKQTLLEIDKLLSSSLINREIGEEAKDWKLISDASKELVKKEEKILEQIEKLVDNKLEYSRA